MERFPVEIPFVGKVGDTPDIVKNKVEEAVRGMVPELKNETLDVQPVLGGITNRLFKASGKKLAVIVRLFGGEGLNIDRDRETAIFMRLNSLGLAPKCYGCFQNGRVEAFIQAKTLKNTDLMQPEYMPKIARKLALFHSSGDKVLPASDPKVPQLYAQIDEWFAAACGATFFEGSSPESVRVT
eukprot:Rmarinus@m.23758